MTYYHLPDLNPTTRCYARSLMQAWPHHYPEWFEPHERKSHGITFWAGVFLWVVIALIYWRFL